jgi:hypothetical protein
MFDGIGQEMCHTECNGGRLLEGLEWKGNDAKIRKDFLERMVQINALA